MSTAGRKQKRWSPVQSGGSVCGDVSPAHVTRTSASVQSAPAGSCEQSANTPTEYWQSSGPGAPAP